MLKNYDFIKNKKYTYIVLSFLIIVGLASFIFQGFNIDIDFSGGTELQLSLGSEVTEDNCKQINKIIEEKFGKDYVSSTVKSPINDNEVVIRTGTKSLDNDQQATLTAALKEAFPNADFEKSTYNSISASIGNELKNTAILAVSIAVLLMLIYIWFRFELISGLAAILCLVHDLFIMLILYSVFRIPINATVIAAFLTILGYSINAAIIVFDRIRENRKRFMGGMAFDDIVNLSIHQTLARSVNTTLTTLFTIGMIYILGVQSIRNFALPLIVGIIAGMFSSVFLAGLLWSEGEKIKARINKNKKAKAK